MATIPERVELTLSAFLSLESSTVAPSACGPAEPGELITLQAGDALTFDSAPDVAMALVYVSRDGQDADPRRFIQLVSPTVVATTGPTSVRVEPDDRIDQLRVCRATPS